MRTESGSNSETDPVAPDASHPLFSRNLKVVVEYDGTNYVGWQFQKNGISIQEKLETALGRVVGHPVRVIAAGRTDAGVHARGQVANFFTNCTLPPRAIHMESLRYLPEDIAVRSVEDVPADFNARRSATMRWYKFYLLNRSLHPTTGRQFVTHVYGKLDFDEMEKACSLFEGVHDFRAFRSINCQATRTVLSFRRPRILRLPNNIVTIDYMARSFLQNMVRVMTGTLVSIGRGRISADTVTEMLETGRRPVEAVTLSPNGLFLYRVFYGDEPPEGVFPADED